MRSLYIVGVVVCAWVAIQAHYELWLAMLVGLTWPGWLGYQLALRLIERLS